MHSSILRKRKGDTQIRQILKTDSDLNKKIMDFCKQIAGSMKIVAISVFDNCLAEYANSKGTMEVIMVIQDFQPRLMSYVKAFDGRNVVVFVVDQWIFERDIERGFLGEASVGTLVFPHTVIVGGDYLRAQEILLKKRLILELLENLAISFPELARRIRIKPEYFMYETMLNRIRVFPPLAYSASNLPVDRENRDSTALVSYREALKQLELEKKVVLSDNHVMIPEEFVSGAKKHKVRLAKISRNAPRTIFTSLFEAFPQLLNAFAKTAEKGFGIQRLALRKDSETKPFVDPHRYILVPTAKGFVSLADRVSVENFARKVLLNNEQGDILLRPIGGVLNDVYVVEAGLGGNRRRLLIKRFKDWSGIKWFPLNIWALGARTFAVLGRTRLERECAINDLLRKEGFNVPNVLHVSHSKRLVFMEYIEGENLCFALKRMVASGKKEKVTEDLAVIAKVGETLARVHALKVTLGDTKPENIIIDLAGKIYLLDFEQASNEGDKAWDVAEFLYYSGHFLSSLRANATAQLIAEAFIQGYLKAGGDPTVIKKAGAQKYVRVFSFFTMPSVLLTMSNACKSVKTVIEEKD